MVFYMSERKRGRREEKNAIQMRKMKKLLVKRASLVAFLVAQMVKNPPAMRETWVQSLSLEDPLEERMATHSSILTWRIPMDRGAWQATVLGVAKSRTQLSD